MCETSDDGFDGYKTLVCQVGDLVPGRRFRTHTGEDRMVIDYPPVYDGYTLTVDPATGRVHDTPNGVKLGTDREGRLYASCYLNCPF